jgi:nitroimidazol reductase NimA-like FMN-containing flavoprotein (pyridoxamine 5'-phosphate oxidase superfamily)
VLDVTDRTRLTRLPYRQVTDRSVLYEVLDAGLVAHVALTTDHGPVVLPVGYGRDGERLLLHGSTGGGLLRAAVAGTALAVCVTLLDGLVYARSMFDSSMNYRSVVVFGRAQPLEGEAKLAGLRLISERLMPGRWAEVRPPTAKELAATVVLALGLDEVSVKVRSGPPSEDEPVPGAGGVWAGVLPLHTVGGRPVPAPDVPAGLPVPPSLAAASTRVQRSASPLSDPAPTLPAGSTIGPTIGADDGDDDQGHRTDGGHLDG